MCVLTRCLARVPGIGQQVVPLRCPDWCSSFSVIAIRRFPSGNFFGFDESRRLEINSALFDRSW